MRTIFAVAIQAEELARPRHSRQLLLEPRPDPLELGVAPDRVEPDVAHREEPMADRGDALERLQSGGPVALRELRERQVIVERRVVGARLQSLADQFGPRNLGAGRRGERRQQAGREGHDHGHAQARGSARHSRRRGHGPRILESALSRTAREGPSAVRVATTAERVRVGSG
jgi:hypothetical protein